MSCTFSREQLALHLEGDLAAAAAQATSSHVAACEDCRRFLEQLRTRQSLLKSLRHDSFSPSECIVMRREVMAIISARRDRRGWALRIERAITLGCRRRTYALAACVLLAITSASLLAQIRRSAPEPAQALAVFDSHDALFRPDGYRDWIVVAPSMRPDDRATGHRAAPATSAATNRVFINPAGYQGYVNTGRFPEGTVMVWESVEGPTDAAAHPQRQVSVLLAAAKDSRRFDGGWGFFDFSAFDERVASPARALPESSGCRTCHQQDAETDHVFTQFYPVLRSARQGAQLTMSQGRVSLTTPGPSSSPSRSLRPLVVAL